jgi:hypothetical protein
MAGRLEVGSDSWDELKMEWTFIMAEFYFRGMECNPVKMFRPVFAGILLGIITCVLMMGGNATPALAQASSNTSGALPATYDEWKAQNASNEKSSRSVQTFAIVAVVAVVGLGLFRRWYMRD